MTPQEWDRVKALFEAALPYEPAVRQQFLAEACPDDAVRKEVEKLLAYHQEAGSFLGSATGASIGASPAAESFAPGRTLGHFRLLEEIGKGGMGVVYKAVDTRLNRPVAIKVLPDDKVASASSRARFLQEAKAASALNHPHIVTVHEIAEHDGHSYIVMEFVDGAPLSELIPKGGMKLGEALRVAAQAADALAAAHTAGIVHRDVKPGNVMLDKSGRVKVLDFGLAKMVRPAAKEGSDTATVTRTEEGTILGTAAYMSPEQAEGKAADARSDIFSFGSTLYEMATGERAFAGENSMSVLAAILREEPKAAGEIRPELPAELQRLIERCLRKDPERRYQHLTDVKVALVELQEEGEPGRRIPGAGLRPRRRNRWLPATAAACAVLGVAAGVFMRSARSPAQWSGVMLGGPEMAIGPRVSPDGHLLAFQAMIDGQTQVALMKPETGNWSVLTKDRTHGTIINISWSADGSQIYYDRIADVPQGVFTIPVLGGEERQLIENAMSPEPLPDGSLLALRLNGQRRQLFRFSPDSGRLRDYAVRVDGVNYVRVLAGAREAVVFGAPLGNDNETAQFLGVDLTSGAVRRLRAEASVSALGGGWAPTPDGESIITTSSSGSMTRVLRTPVSGTRRTQTLFTSTEVLEYLDLAPDGAIYTNTFGRPAELVRLSVAGTTVGRVANLQRVTDTDTIALLPDGRAVFTASDSGRARLMAVAMGRDPTPLINTMEETSAPLALAGPREIAFVVGPEPRQTIAIADIATGRITRRLTPAKGVLNSLAASPDGKTLYFGAGFTIWSVPSAGGDATAIRPGNSVVVEPSGTALVVSMSERTETRLFSVPLNGGPEHEIIMDHTLPLGAWFPLTPGGIDRNGRLLVPLSPRDSWFNPIGVLTLKSGRIARVPSDNRSDYHTMVWTPDGQILALRVGLQAKIWKFIPEAK